MGVGWGCLEGSCVGGVMGLGVGRVRTRIRPWGLLGAETEEYEAEKEGEEEGREEGAAVLGV